MFLIRISTDTFFVLKGIEKVSWKEKSYEKKRKELLLQNSGFSHDSIQDQGRGEERFGNFHPGIILFEWNEMASVRVNDVL